MPAIHCSTLKYVELHREQRHGCYESSFSSELVCKPYHAPVFVAKELGYFEQGGINLSVLELTDPSDVTELVDTGRADMGLKAMIHTIAGQVRGFLLKALGMLLDEPPTSVLYSNNNITLARFRT